AAHRFCGYDDTMFGLEGHRERGTTPPRAAPAIDTWSFFQQGTQRARQPWPQDGRLDRNGELPVWIDPYSEAPGTIRPHNPGHAGTRAQQERRNLRGLAARSTEQQDMERQQIAIACAAEYSAHLGLLRWRDLQYSELTL